MICFFCLVTVSHRIHVWYVCLHLVDFFTENIGKYGKYMP